MNTIDQVLILHLHSSSVHYHLYILAIIRRKNNAFPDSEGKWRYATEYSGVGVCGMNILVKTRCSTDILLSLSFFNEVDEQFLRSGPYEEVAARIRGIRGIGEWSAHFILVRGLGRMEHVSSIEKELLKAASTIYSDDPPLSAAELQQILDRYGRTQGYWAFYARNASFDPSQPMEAME